MAGRQLQRILKQQQHDVAISQHVKESSSEDSGDDGEEPKPFFNPFSLLTSDDEVRCWENQIGSCAQLCDCLCETRTYKSQLLFIKQRT